MPTNRRATVLVDWKSSTHKSLEMQLQLGGYYLATSTYDKGTGQWGFKPPVDYGAIIHTSAEGVRPLLVMNQAELTEAASAFQEALRLYRYLAKYDPYMKEPSRYPIGGKQYVSVTEVLKYVVAKPNLFAWGVKMAKEGKDPNAIRDAKAGQGSTIHKNLLFFLRGDAVDVTALDYVTKTLGHFERWCKAWNVQAVELEQTLVHQELGFAGTSDAVLTVDEAQIVAWLEQKREVVNAV